MGLRPCATDWGGICKLCQHITGLLSASAVSGWPQCVVVVSLALTGQLATYEVVKAILVSARKSLS